MKMEDVIKQIKREMENATGDKKDRLQIKLDAARDQLEKSR